MADDSRKDMTRPRVRVSPNSDVTAQIRKVYGPKPGQRLMQGDAGCSPPIGKAGVLPPSNTGFVDQGPDFQKVQDPYGKHASNYDNEPTGWERGGPKGGEGRPSFDSSKKAKGASGLGGGGDAKKSPFSSANKTYTGD